MTIARSTDVTAMSTTSLDDAIKQGLMSAAETLGNVQAAWIKDHEVLAGEGGPEQFKVSMRVSFVLDD